MGGNVEKSSPAYCDDSGRFISRTYGCGRTDYPARTTTIICPYTPGGATVILARMLGRRLEERLGKSFVTENRPGAGTVLAAHIVAKAQPDGYTLLMGTSTPLAINATLHRKLPYDSAKDFVPLVRIANVPFVLVVTPSLPVKSVADLIEYAKDNPGKLSFGTSGPGSPHHLYMELFKTLTSTEIVHVPYKGSVPALTDVIAGRIPVMFVGGSGTVLYALSNRHITPEVRRDLVYAASATGCL